MEGDELGFWTSQVQSCKLVLQVIAILESYSFYTWIWKLMKWKYAQEINSVADPDEGERCAPTHPLFVQCIDHGFYIDLWQASARCNLKFQY